jgi:hypothetical protein
MNFKVVCAAIFCTLLFLIAPEVLAQNLISHAPKDAQAYIIEPTDGATLPETFTVKFGLSGMDLAPAGKPQENTGHHHLLIDQPEFDATASLPSTEQIRHFGKAQTETELSLTPGEHTLQLVLGNYAHVPHDHPVISKPIKVTIQ